MSPTTRRAQAIPAGSPGHCIHSLPEDSPAHESRFCHASASRRSAAAARRNRAGRSLGCEATLTQGAMPTQSPCERSVELLVCSRSGGAAKSPGHSLSGSSESRHGNSLCAKVSQGRRGPSQTFLVAVVHSRFARENRPPASHATPRAAGVGLVRSFVRGHTHTPPHSPTHTHTQIDRHPRTARPARTEKPRTPEQFRCLVISEQPAPNS